MPQVFGETPKKTVKIDAFAGLNHTDFTLPGEWYAMCNLTDTYSPLLTPRTARKKRCTLAGKAHNVLYKNGMYYYSAEGGIYCYAPQGKNPFGNAQTVCIYASADTYDFIEMGNKVLCVNTGEHVKHLSIENNRVIELGNNANYEYRSYAHFSGNTDVKEVVAYLNRHNVLYRSMSGDTLKHLTLKEGKWYDAAAGELLNVCFTYEVEREDGTRYIFGDTKHRYNPAAPPAFANSRYFLGTDNKFYYYNKDSASAYEVQAPNIAIFMRKGLQADGVGYPQISAGDYIRFSLGYSMNYNHVTQDYHIYPTKEKALMENLLLRINRTTVCNERTGAGWYEQGWEYCMVVDYNTALLNAVIKNNLFLNSASYLDLTDYTITDPHADIGRQQIYPRYLKIESPFPVLSAFLEHNNRVWGAANEQNEIKASALGNYHNWDEYLSLPSDSYTASVGSDGAFTASCALGEYLYFFKENAYSIVFGTRPANFCVQTENDFIGIDKQGAGSLQVIGRSAYYMGIDGKIYCFNGSGAVCISKALGEERYTPLSAAHTAHKYFLLVRDAGGQKRLLTYNVQSGTWFCEDAGDVERIFNLRSAACALCFAQTGASGKTVSDILLLEPEWNTGSEKNDIHWWCESGIIGFESDYFMYISDLKIRFESEIGAKLEIFAKYDNETDYTPLASFISQKKELKTVKIRVKRCAFLRLKLQGSGFSKVFSVSFLTKQGSEK